MAKPKGWFTLVVKISFLCHKLGINASHRCQFWNPSQPHYNYQGEANFSMTFFVFGKDVFQQGPSSSSKEVQTTLGGSIRDLGTWGGHYQNFI